MTDADTSQWSHRWSRARFDALPETGEPLSKTRVFELLASVRRRYVVEHLDAADRTVEVRPLIDAVAEREFGPDPAYDERKRVYVSLRQTHLPRLAEARVVEYDADRGRVAVGDRFGALAFALGALGARPLADEEAASAAAEQGPTADANRRASGPPEPAADAGSTPDAGED
ncbi:DUF7344 domain-containing protein [Halobaculum marinum]|uniref:DUF7344 domain-containing protein n=1 Tax=Halobaculum marinum TaxID=3031996 RepID=A0ABD5WWZ2_9EURY|nr:hypothetical protein [Halobaculum sp. DT55]